MDSFILERCTKDLLYSKVFLGVVYKNETESRVYDDFEIILNELEVFKLNGIQNKRNSQFAFKSCFSYLTSCLWSKFLGI